VKKNERDVAEHEKTIEKILEELGKKANVSDLRSLMDKLQNAMKQLEGLKLQMAKIKDVADRPDISKLLQDMLKDLTSQFNDFKN